ncbi:hypothetical protein N7522_005637 [Penicillium canescens]|nr:hypothetical protein N7522_005637 [Penicillium canescens]
MALSGLAIRQTEVDILKDHLTLFKGKACLELQFVECSIIEGDGSINIMQLASPRRGDFNRGILAHNWIPEKEIAKKYR